MQESKYSSSCFNRNLKHIRELEVNPVTISARWEVNKLKNAIDEVHIRGAII